MLTPNSHIHPLLKGDRSAIFRRVWKWGRGRVTGHVSIDTCPDEILTCLNHQVTQEKGGGETGTCREAETKKNCCFRRSSFPYSVASLGYSTALMSSAFRLSSTACKFTAIASCSWLASFE